MKNGVLIVSIVAILAFATWFVIGFSNNPVNESKILDITGELVGDFSGQKKMIDTENSLFEFTGGKVVGAAHVGTFEDWKGFVYVDDGEISGIEGVAQVSSIKTDNERVDGHLQTEDFFNAENYPEIKFTSTNVDVDKGEITGILEMAGKQKELTVPATFKDGKISSEFSFDADEFFKFDALITEIGVKFDFVY